jgi:hypothetical protein
MSLPAALRSSRAPQIGLGHLAVVLDGEDERDVDVDTLGERLPNGGDACRCGGNLHHQVRAINRVPEAPHLRERPFGILCQIGRDFDADEAILPLRALIGGAQQVSDRLHVGHRQCLINLLGTLSSSDQLLHLLIVGAAMCNRVFKNGGITRRT